MAHSARPHLEKLLEAILQERHFAKQLELDEMKRVMQEKEDIIQILSHFTKLDPEDYDIAKQVSRENRRNAFLFRSTLRWIRDTMEFFGRKSVTETYSSRANTVSSHVNGRLLSGKV